MGVRVHERLAKDCELLGINFVPALSFPLRILVAPILAPLLLTSQL